jgi:hypothetical protein
LKYFLLIFLLFLSLNAKILTYNICPKNTLHVKCLKIKILDVKELLFDEKKGIPFHEISDLAYKNGFIYFVSDQGYLYKFSINLSHSKMNDLKYLDAYALKNKKMQKLSKKKRDAEGLALYEDNLLISFERKQRINLYSKNGIQIKKIKIHQDLEKKNNFISKNKGLESVAFHKKFGIITAPELPLKSSNKKYHTLYSRNNKFKFMTDGGSIVSLEFFDKNTILVLLRDFNYMTRRRVTTLVKVYLNKCNKNQVCKSDVLAKLNSADGWQLDNFEGLTRIDTNRYLMVSDDNENIFQKTLLVLFEIKG